MNVKVKFNRPKQSIDHSELMGDIQSAVNRLCVAAAWITDVDIAKAIIESKAIRKVVLLNAADMKRESVRASSMLISYHQDYLGSLDWKRVVGAEPEYGNGVVLCVLGGEDWKIGVMHHKFIVADDVVWTGSFNYTMQALKNYENMVRIEDADIASEFWREALSIAKEEGSFVNGQRFKCCACGKIMDIKEIGNPVEDSHGEPYCAPCWSGGYGPL